MCKLPDGRQVESQVGAHLEELEGLCREFVGGQRHLRPEHEDWFHLGLEIVGLLWPGFAQLEQVLPPASDLNPSKSRETTA